MRVSFALEAENPRGVSWPHSVSAYQSIQGWNPRGLSVFASLDEWGLTQNSSSAAGFSTLVGVQNRDKAVIQTLSFPDDW